MALIIRTRSNNRSRSPCSVHVDKFSREGDYCFRYLSTFVDITFFCFIFTFSSVMCGIYISDQLNLSHIVSHLI